MPKFDPDNNLGDKDEVDEVIGDLREEERLEETVQARKESKEVSPRENGNISAEQFQEMLNSDRFIAALSIIDRITRKTGHETGFNIILSKTGEFYFSDLIEGLTDRMSLDNVPPKIIRESELDFIDIANRQVDNGEKFCYPFSLHFHPDSKGRICPSMADLNLIMRVEGIEGIGQAEKGKIKVLLIKQSVMPIGAELEDELDAIRNYTTQAKVNEILNENGFENIIITFVKVKGKYELSEDSKKDLKRFGNITVVFE